MYTELKKAREELRARQHKQQEIESWWQEMGWGKPPLPEVNYPAVLARHVATARYEDVLYWQMAQKAGLTPTWLEYTTDKFVCCSPYKRSLVKRTVCAGRGRNGGWKRSTDNVMGIESCKGQRICDLKTPNGLALVDYHHNIQAQVIPGAIHQDFSGWLSQIGVARDYYTAYLSCFIAHGVLFEDYHGGESGQELDGFTMQVFERSHAEVVRRFGVNPLLVKMPWWEGLDFYPADSNWQEHGVIPSEFMFRRAA